MRKCFSINVDIDRVSFNELEFLGDCLGLNELASQAYEYERDKEAGYVAVNCEPADSAGFWKNVQRYLQENPAVADACVVVCTGEQGWDDYLLLHHFAPGEDDGYGENDANKIDAFPVEQ